MSLNSLHTAITCSRLLFEQVCCRLKNTIMFNLVLFTIILQTNAPKQACYLNNNNLFGSLEMLFCICITIHQPGARNALCFLV